MYIEYLFLNEMCPNNNFFYYTVAEKRQAAPGIWTGESRARELHLCAGGQRGM